MKKPSPTARRPSRVAVLLVFILVSDVLHEVSIQVDVLVSDRKQTCRNIGFPPSAQAASCPCKFCGKATFCHSIGLTTVPVGIPARGMKRLLLNSNSINRLRARDFYGMTDLVLLALYNNSISDVDEMSFDGLASLESLHLENNRISRLHTGSLRVVPKLRNLFLDHNRLTTFPGDVSYLHRLEKLTLSHNNLKLIHWSSFVRLDQLRVITLWVNPLRCDCNRRELKRWFATTPHGQSINAGTPTTTCPELQAANLTCEGPVVVKVAPGRRNATADTNVYVVSETVVLHCSVTGRPRPLVVWRTPKRGLVYPYGDGDAVVFLNGSLLLRQLSKSDSGIYTCIARLTGQRFHDAKNATLYVIDGVKPEVTARQRQREVTVGDTVEFSCRVTGAPYPVVTWYAPGVNISSAERTGERFAISSDETALLIKSVSLDDTGEWICAARNSLGEDQDSVKLTVDNPLLDGTTIIIIGCCAGVTLILLLVAVGVSVRAVRKRRRRKATTKTGDSGDSGATGQRQRAKTKENKRFGESKSNTLPGCKLEQPFQCEPTVKGFRL